MYSVRASSRAAGNRILKSGGDEPQRSSTRSVKQKRALEASGSSGITGWMFDESAIHRAAGRRLVTPGSGHLPHALPNVIVQSP